MATASSKGDLLVASKLMQHYRVFTPLSAAKGIQAVVDHAGNVEIITLGNDGGLYSLWPDQASDTGWQITSLNANQMNLGAVTSFSATHNATGNITVIAQFADAPNVYYTISDERWSPGWQKVSSSAVDETLAKAAAFRGFFSVQNTALYYKPTSGPTVKLSGLTKVSTTFVATRNFQGFLEVFILGTDGNLYHVRAAPDLTQPPETEPDPGAASNWTHLAPLNPVQSDTSLQFSQLTLAKDKDGYSKVFAVSVTDDLYEVWQAAETTDWNFRPIALPDYNPKHEGKATPIRVYMTELSVLDHVGAPRPNTAVTLWTSDETTASVNGRSCNLDSLTPYMCLSNAAGKVTVLIESNTLDAPLLKVTTDFMDGDEYISVEPNAYIQEQLVSLTANGLTGATNLFSKKPVTVVPSDLPSETLNAIVSGVSQCMSLAGQPIEPSSSVDIPGPKHLSRNKHLRGLKYVSHAQGEFRHRIDLSRVKEQHWRLRFDHKTKNHRFEKLAREQAANLMRERSDKHESVSSLADWFDVDWGEVWDQIESVTEMVVTTVVDQVTNVVSAIQVQLTLLIDGITYLFEQAVDLVEQVFDAVEGIFEAVGTFFNDLFDWFGFLFEWSDILLTQQALVDLIAQVALPFAKQVFGAGGKLNTLLTAQIREFQNNLAGLFGAFSQSLGITNSTSISTWQGTIPPNDIDDQVAGTNLAFSGLLDNVKSVEFTNPGRAALLASEATGTDSSFSALVDQLTTSLDNSFFNEPAFAQAISYFQAIGDNPDQFLQNALGGILSAIQGILNTALNVAAAAVNAIFECVQAVLQAVDALLRESLYVPLVSELFTLVTSQDHMSILGLFALIVAIPVTIVYKILFSEAPFTNADSVSQFIQYLNQALSPATDTNQAKPAPQTYGELGGTAKTVSRVLSAIEGSCFFVYAFFESVLDRWPLPPDTASSAAVEYLKPFAIFSWGAAVCEWFIFVASVPRSLISLPGSMVPPSCDSTAGLEVTAWFVEGLTPALDTLWMWKTSTIMRNQGTLGVATDWILAMIQLGMLCGLTAKQSAENKIDTAATIRDFFALVPGLFKFCRFPIRNLLPATPAALAFDAYAPLVLALLDVVGDLTASGASFAQLIGEAAVVPA
jgi:hypothetical protein